MLKKMTALTLLSLSLSAQANVLTTIKPLGFIANAITAGVTETEVLLPDNASVHDYSLRLSDVAKVKEADLVVWVGEGMDGFLAKPVAQRNEKNVLTLSSVLMKNENQLRQAEHHHHDDEEEHEHHHHHESIDWHIWLSPELSEVIAENLAEKLTDLYPAQSTQIQTNLTTFKANLAKTKADIHQNLQNKKATGFYVYHDAYGYFNQSFGLNQRGYFTLNPSITTGAKTLAEVKRAAQNKEVQCLFTEPQFTPQLVKNIAEETGTKVGVLDPMGGSIPLNKEAYFAFLKSLAKSYEDCL